MSGSARNIAIYAMYIAATPKVTQREIAAYFSISVTRVCQIIKTESERREPHNQLDGMAASIHSEMHIAEEDVALKSRELQGAVDNMQLLHAAFDAALKKEPL